MSRFKYFLLRLLHISNCFNCKYWEIISPTWENPGGGECCSKHKREWSNNEGCKFKELEK